MSEIIPFAATGPRSSDSFSPPPQRPNEYPETKSAEGIQLRDLLALLWRHRWLIAAVTSVVFGAALYMVLRRQPQYNATAVIRLLDERKAISGGIEGAALEQMMGRANDPLLSQMQVLRSRSVGGAVVDRLGLRLRPIDTEFPMGLLSDIRVLDSVAHDTIDLRFGDTTYSATLVGSTSNGSVNDSVVSNVDVLYGQPVAIGGVSFTVAGRPEKKIEEPTLVVRDREGTILWLLENLRVSARERTDVVDVVFTTTDPRLAQTIVNSLVDEFRALNTQEAQDQSRRRRIFIEEQLSQTDSLLTSAQLGLANFQRKEEVFSSQKKFADQQAGMLQLDVRREELDADRRMLYKLVSTLKNHNEPVRSLNTVLSATSLAEAPVVRQLYEQLVRYEITYDSMTTGKWANANTNPDVIRVTQLVTSTREKLVGALEGHISGIQARVDALVDLKERNVADIQSLPTTGAEEVRLVQRVETIRKMADQLREEYQKARIAEAVEAGQVEIVDQAALPAQPIRSGAGLKLVLGLMLGFVLGSGVALLIEHLNTAIRRKEDLEDILRIPTLAIIPQIHATQSNSIRSRLERQLTPLLGSGKPKNGQEPLPVEGIRNELVTASNSRASGSEAYRTLRTNLIFSQSVHSIRTLIVTSSGPSEGKTTTAANLAVTFAQQGMKVLIIDCDLRKPRQQDIFSIRREPGLTQWMLGFNELKESIRATGIEGLSVMPAGTLPPNPSDMVSGERMSQVIRDLEKEYDLIIIDTCPLLVASDAAVLATYGQGVLLVVRAGHTDRGAALQSVQQLRAVGARVLGAVLNDPDAKVPTYGGYYYYDRYYGAEA